MIIHATSYDHSQLIINMNCMSGISSLRLFSYWIRKKNIQLFCQLRVSKCNIVVFLSFQSRLLSVCWTPAGYWRPRLARISRILAVFGFSSPILETHQLVYLVLWSHRYTDPHKCFQSHRVRVIKTGQRYRDAEMLKIALLCRLVNPGNVCIWLIKT